MRYTLDASKKALEKATVKIDNSIAKYLFILLLANSVLKNELKSSLKKRLKLGK